MQNLDSTRLTLVLGELYFNYRMEQMKNDDLMQELERRRIENENLRYQLEYPEEKEGAGNE